MLRVLIVDDKQPARDELKCLLSRSGALVIGEADGAADAIALAARVKPDAVFLAVGLREMNGLETAKVIRRVAERALIVFATAYEEYALQAFELGAVDYVLKPFDERRILKTVRRLRAYRMEEWANVGARSDRALDPCKLGIHKLPVEKDGKIILIDYESIYYAYAHAGSAIVVAERGEAPYAGSLSELETRVRGTSLLRVHKSYLVNMQRVKEVVPWFKGTYWLKLAHETEIEIPVSKNQIKEIKTLLGLK